MTTWGLGVWYLCHILVFATPWLPEEHYETRVMTCRECRDLVTMFRAMGRPAWGECYR